MEYHPYRRIFETFVICIHMSNYVIALFRKSSVEGHASGSSPRRALSTSLEKTPTRFKGAVVIRRFLPPYTLRHPGASQCATALNGPWSRWTLPNLCGESSAQLAPRARRVYTPNCFPGVGCGPGGVHV